LFIGPVLPSSLVRPGLAPLLRELPTLRFQVLQSHDVAEAFRLCLVHEGRGAFNLAADPVIDAAELARLLGARAVRVPIPAVRAALAAAWRL
jgi:UDP-glucose 4-epimerase